MQNWYIRALQHAPSLTFFPSADEVFQLVKTCDEEMTQYRAAFNRYMIEIMVWMFLRLRRMTNVCSLASKKKQEIISKGMGVAHSHSVKVFREVIFFLYTLVLFWLPLDRNISAAVFGAAVRASLLFVCQYWYRKLF